MFFGLRKWEFVTPTCLDIPGAGARIDLSRADQLDTDRGWAIVQQNTPIGSDGVALGEGSTLRDVLAGLAMKDAWFATLGTRPDGDNLDEILFDHLESKADPTGVDTARPLELAAGNLEVWLGIRQKAVIPFANGTTQERAAFVRMVQRIRSRLNEARTKSQAGQLPADIYRKILVMEARKIGVSPASLKPKNWRADETPLTPETTVSDSFASMASFTRATGAGTWSASSGLYLTRSGWSGVLDTVKHNTAMSANDNWSDLTTPLVNGTAIAGGAYVGPICRFGSSGSACYQVGIGHPGGTGPTPKLQRFGASSNTTAQLAWFQFDAISTYGSPVVFRCKAVGSTISGYLIGNQTDSVSVTDTNITTGLYGGVGCDDATNSSNSKIANSISITDGLTDPPVVTSNSASGQVGTAFSYQIVGTNTPTEYAASELPSGLSVNTTTGLITGNPTQSGTFSIPISATNAGGTGTGTLTLVIQGVGSSAVTHATGRRR